MSVSEMIAEIRDKTGMGGADHGVFQPSQAGNPKARWLRGDKTLRFYDIQSGMDVEYKKKHRQLKVKLLDDTQKIIMVDESSTVAEITEVIADKLSIKNSEEFSIKLEGGSLWLNPQLSLTEQGVDELSVLVFKKKFFFNDANVDKSDPIQLHLLYIQMKGAIVAGDHPVTKDEARDLAAIQMQIQQGDFKPEKHKVGSTYVNLEELVSPQYQKIKGLDKDILSEYRKLVGMTDENAKYRYVQLCRSLKSYGTTFFEVKELINKKPVPRLLGITRNNIFRMDPVTREVLKDHDITHLKRWSASPTQFLMDFGEYETDYVRLQTPEAETISQIIAGYIDIILKVRKDGGVVLEEEEGEEAMVESVSAITGLATSSTTTGMVSGGLDDSMGQYGLMGGAGQMAGRMGPQGMMGLLLNPTDALSCLAAARSLLDHFQNPALLPGADAAGLSLDQWKTQLGTNMAALMAAAQALVDAAESGQSLRAMDPLAKNLFGSLKDMIGAARAAAVLAGDGDVSLLDGAKAVSEAIAKVLQASMELARNPHDPAAQEALRAAKMALQNAATFLQAASSGMIADGPSQSLLAEAAKLVAASVTQLVGDAARVARETGSAEVLDACRGTGVAANRLVVTASAVAPAMTSEAVRVEIGTLAYSVDEANRLLLAALEGSGTDATTLAALRDAAAAVSHAVRQLMDATECASAMGAEPQDFVSPIAVIHERVADLDQNARTQPRVIGPDTRDIAQAVAQLVGAAKQTAKHTGDRTLRAALLEASKGVIETLAALQESSKRAQANPRDVFSMQQLESSAEAVDAAARAVLTSAGDRCVMDSVRYWAKVAAASLAATVAAANGAALRTDEDTRVALVAAARTAGGALAPMVSALKDSTRKPDDSHTSAQLVAMCTQAAHPGAKLVAVSKGAIPRVDDVTRKTQLNGASDDLQKALTQLMAALKAGADHKSAASKEVREALAQLGYIQADLEATLFASDAGALPRPANVDLEPVLQTLALACRQLQEQVPPLRAAGKSCPEDVGPAAKEASGSLYAAVTEAKTIAACAVDGKTQRRIIHASKALAVAGSQLIEQTMAASQLPDNPVLQAGVDEAADDLNARVVELLNAARGLDTRELDDATMRLVDTADRMHETQWLMARKGAASSRNAAEWLPLAEALTAKAQEYTVACASVASKAEDTQQAPLVAAAKRAAELAAPFSAAVAAAVAQCPDDAVAEALVREGRAMVVDGARVVEDAKVHATTHDAASKKALSDHQRGVRDHHVALLEALGSAQPGYREVTEAQRTLAKLLAERDLKAMDPGTSATLQQLVESCRHLGELTSLMVAQSRTHPVKLGDHSQSALKDFQIISKAAYSVSSNASNANSNASKIPKQFEKVGKELLETVDRMDSLDSNQIEECLQEAKQLAKGTMEIVEAARTYVEQGQGDRDAQRNAIYATEKLGNATAAVARAVRTHGRTADALMGVRAAVADVVSAVWAAHESPEGALGLATRVLMASGSDVLGAAAAAVANPKDGRAHNKLASAAQSLPDALQTVVNAATALTPGVAECDAAVGDCENAMGELDAARIAATFGQLESAGGRTHQECQKELVQVSKALSVDVATLAAADPKALASASKATGDHVRLLAELIKNAAATTSNREVQTDLLSHAKGLCEALLSLLQAARAGAAGTLTSSASDMKEKAMASNKAIAALASSLKTGVVSLRELDEAIARISNMESELTPQALAEKEHAGEPMSYPRAQQQLKNGCQALVEDLSALVSNAKTNVEELGATAKVLAAKVEKVVAAVRGAVGATDDAKAKAGLGDHGRASVAATAELVRRAREVANDPKNRATLQKLQQSFAGVSQSVAALLEASYAGAVGERECDEAAAALGRLVAELDAAALFAAAGQQENVSNAATTNASSSSLKTYEMAHKETMEQSQVLEKATQELASAGSDQTRVAQAARALVPLGRALAEDAKSLGALGGDKKFQQDLLDGTKEAARRTQALVLHAKEALGGSGDDAEQRELAAGVVAKAAEAAAEALHELRDCMETAAQDSAKGIMEIDKARAAVKAEAERYPQADYRGKSGADAAEVVQFARAVAQATGELVAGAGASQDELVKGVQMTAPSVAGLLAASKGAGAGTADLEVRRRVDAAALQTAEASLRLLEAAKTASKNPLNMVAQNELSRSARECADGLQEVVSSANRLPGGEGLTLEEDTGDDIEEAAERELRACAEAIENAAATISNRGQLDASMDDTLKEVTAAILDAARAIAGATSTLVKCAHSAQKERVEKGKNPKTKHLYRKDPKWANGLISAAQTVAATTRHLVQQANASSKGSADEEVLVASARAVAAATAQLVSASAAKADNPNSKTQSSLKAAAKAVANATAKLVEAAKNSGKSSAHNSEIELSSGAKAEFEQNVVILKLEKELEQARLKLAQMRRAQYSKK